MREQGQVPGPPVSGNKFDLAAARARCEAIVGARRARSQLMTDDPKLTLAYLALTDLPAALKALEEAQKENQRLRASGADVSGLLLGAVETGGASIADLERQLAEAQGKLDAVKEQVAYGFTGETLANMKDGMSGKEMNEWWRKTLDRILSKEGE